MMYYLPDATQILEERGRFFQMGKTSTKMIFRTHPENLLLHFRSYRINTISPGKKRAFNFQCLTNASLVKDGRCHTTQHGSMDGDQQYEKNSVRKS